MDCHILSSNALLAIGASIGFGAGGTGGLILGWTGQSFVRIIVPPSVKDTVAPLHQDLKEISSQLDELKKIPGAAAVISATNSTAKTALPDIVRLEWQFIQYSSRVQKLEKDLKAYPHVYLLLTEAGRKLRAELNKVTAKIAELKESVNNTTTQARTRNLQAREHQYGSHYGADAMTSSNSALMEILVQERETPLHLPSDSHFAPSFYDKPASQLSAAPPLFPVQVV